jgi:hypothetical protein
MSTSLRSGDVLDVLSSTPAGVAVRAPRIHGPLTRLVTILCENRGRAAGRLALPADGLDRCAGNEFPNQPAVCPGRQRECGEDQGPARGLVPRGCQPVSVEFYGAGVDATWSDRQVYWLRRGSQAGRRIQSQSASGSGTAPASFPFTVQWKPRLVSFVALINGDADNYFGPAVTLADPVTQSLPVANPSAGAPGNSTLQVRMQGVTAGAIPLRSCRKAPARALYPLSVTPG